MACNSLCFCFSGEPLRPDEYGAEGGRGSTYEKYATNRETFQLGMGDAPLRAPLQCLAGGFPITFICCQWHMRYRALNHVAPGSEWENYLCCQGYLPACLCFQPGHCGEREFPRTCMCLEACLCPGLAVSSTRFLLMDMYHLAADECDNRIIRFNNFVQVLSCVCHCIAMFNRNFRHLARLLDLIAEIVFFATAGCMTAQVDAEINYRDGYDSRKLSEGFSGYFSVHQDERLGGNVAYKTPKGSGEKPPPFAGTPLLTEAMDR